MASLAKSTPAQGTGGATLVTDTENFPQRKEWLHRKEGGTASPETETASLATWNATSYRRTASQP
jgi:hypothetical protein